MSYEPDEIEPLFTGTEYQFGFDVDGVLYAITKPECRICRCTWGPVIEVDYEDDQYGLDFNAFMSSRDARIAELEAERDMLRKALDQATRLLYSYGMEADRDVSEDDGAEYYAWLKASLKQDGEAT